VSLSAEKCPHGYFTRCPSNRCPWCFGFDDSSRDVVPVVGHGNGWLLRSHDSVCTSCGGPATAGWGVDGGDGSPRPPPPTCYVCRIGDNTSETIARLAAHEVARGQKKPRGAKAPT